MKLTLAQLEKEFNSLVVTNIPKRNFNIEIEITKDEEESLIEDIVINYLPPYHKLSTLRDFKYRSNIGIVFKFKVI